MLSCARPINGEWRPAIPRSRPGAGWRTLYHGGIIHGVQYLSNDWHHEPLTYYGHETGIGRALLALEHRPDARVGVVGMGTATVAAYV